MINKVFRFNNVRLRESTFVIEKLVSVLITFSNLINNKTKANTRVLLLEKCQKLGYDDFEDRKGEVLEASTSNIIFLDGVKITHL